MIGYLGDGYLWVRALHLIAVIFWMAGMFMLPRYFAYHAECAVGSAEDRIWQAREQRLLRIIVNPAMFATWILGLMLAGHVGFSGGWLHVKILLVLLLSAFHGMLGRWRKVFARGENQRDSRFYRMVNEVPSVFVIVIVILAVVKPF